MVQNDEELDLIDVEAMPPADWTTERSWTGIAPLNESRRRLTFLARRYCRFRGNKTAMLRDLGVRIGNDTAILNDIRDFASEPWLVEIGNRVTITRGVQFITHDGSSRVFRHLIPNGSRFGNRFGPIRVLDNSFVGVNAILLPDVTVGPNSIIGSGSVVTKDVAPGMVAVGNPARILFSVGEYLARYREKMVP